MTDANTHSDRGEHAGFSQHHPRPRRRFSQSELEEIDLPLSSLRELDVGGGLQESAEEGGEDGNDDDDCIDDIEARALILMSEGEDDDEEEKSSKKEYHGILGYHRQHGHENDRLLDQKRLKLLFHLRDYLEEFHDDTTILDEAKNEEGKSNRSDDKTTGIREIHENDSQSHHYRHHHENNKNNNSSLGKIIISFQPNNNQTTCCNPEMGFSFSFEENNLHALLSGMANLISISSQIETNGSIDNFSRLDYASKRDNISGGICISKQQKQYLEQQRHPNRNHKHTQGVPMPVSKSKATRTTTETDTRSTTTTTTSNKTKATARGITFQQSRKSSISGSFSHVDGSELNPTPKNRRFASPLTKSMTTSSTSQTKLTPEPSSSSSTTNNIENNNASNTTKSIMTKSASSPALTQINTATTTTNNQNHPTKLPPPTPEYFNTFGTKVHVVSEEDWFSDDEAIMQAKDFDDLILSKMTSLENCHSLLRRTRAVAALASRLMAAPDEQSCYELVSRLIVPLFKVDRCSYVLLKDPEHVIVKQITANNRNHIVQPGMQVRKEGVIKPLKGTAAEVCAKTLQQHYTPRTKESMFETQRVVYSMGLNTILSTPILVNGNKFVGCINICMEKEDAFEAYDRILINDVASMLGANIYSKRMRQAAERSNEIAREMLYSMIPAKVIDKIECFWDDKSDQYWRRRSSQCSVTCPDSGNSTLSNSFCEAAKQEVNEKISFLNRVQKRNSEPDDDAVVVTNDFELTSTSRALYAETVNNVCIIFLDIVGFSKFSLDLKPIQVMDLLHDLFARYDALCDKHGIQKLETIGDAFICATNLLKETEDADPEVERFNTKIAALHALDMAKDMVREAESVLIPKSDPISAIDVRVGIHIGQVTCGVLGERLPKFTVLGSAVNLAARMEQTSLPGKIRVTSDFYNYVKDAETNWEHHKVTVKNMGEIDTYLLDPMQEDNDLMDLLSSFVDC